MATHRVGDDVIQAFPPKNSEGQAGSGEHMARSSSASEQTTPADLTSFTLPPVMLHRLFEGARLNSSTWHTPKG